jgi:NADH:ubiquinone oxidoreductase subunit 6 (subunit J)
MPHPLFLQAPTGNRVSEIAHFVETFWPVLLPVALGLAAVYLLLPRVRRYPPLWGGVLAGLALTAGGWLLIRTETALPETVLFYSFSGIAVAAGGLLITLRNPVHAALSFALVVLSSCGLFLLRAAPFLMAATVIIYAGAIVVTFLFVIMLAQQEGFSSADQRSREPFLATVAGFVLLGALLCVLQRTYQDPTLEDLLARVDRALAADNPAEAQARLGAEFTTKFRKHLQLVETGTGLRERRGRTAAEKQTLKFMLDELDIVLNLRPVNPDKLTDQLREIRGRAVWLLANQGSLVARKDLPLSPFSGVPPSEPVPVSEGREVKARLPAHNVSALGRALFSDYLLAVELGGVLLLVATIGAIAIAGRRTEGLR